MVEIDCDDVVALTGEAREDRDDRGQFCIYAENFVRRGRLTGDRAGRGTGHLLDAERLALMSGRVAFR
ncbi:hypothetical protein [Saccharopolyspora sp. NPDC050642]|uniref:hypothetical protein n=1 Tax=Saccharopolyspora sp. NPDC050642 TaxID=3157099 RepID=UPI0033EBA328